MRQLRRPATISSMLLVLLPLSIFPASEPEEQVRKEIISLYQNSIGALRRGDYDRALQMDTDDWVSITLSQKPVTKQENKRYIAEQKPPAGWTAVWKPDYARNGTTTGVQVYQIKLEGSGATVLYLIGHTQIEAIDGAPHQVWNGSHIRDTWVKTSAGWKRRMHEKLTVNERMIDGKPANTANK